MEIQPLLLGAIDSGCQWAEKAKTGAIAGLLDVRTITPPSGHQSVVVAVASATGRDTCAK